MNDGKLNLTVLDVYGDAIAEPIDIFLDNRTLTDKLAIHGARGKSFTIPNLHRTPEGVYSVEVDAPSYSGVKFLTRIPASGNGDLTVTLPVNKDRVTAVTFPPFATLDGETQRVLNGSVATLGRAGQSGEDVYSNLDNLRRAGFLNLMAKAKRTRFTDNSKVVEYIDQITEQLGDRMFALVKPDLHAETVNSLPEGEFHEVPDLLHTPPPGFEAVDSYKTPDLYGNLQLTFSQDASGQWAVDMDIDDAQGFGHFFQVVNNIGGATHPYNIHEILVAKQELDPGYRFQFGTMAKVKAAGSRG